MYCFYIPFSNFMSSENYKIRKERKNLHCLHLQPTGHTTLATRLILAIKEMRRRSCCTKLNLPAEEDCVIKTKTKLTTSWVEEKSGCRQPTSQPLLLQLTREQLKLKLFTTRVFFFLSSSSNSHQLPALSSCPQMHNTQSKSRKRKRKIKVKEQWKIKK